MKAEQVGSVVFIVAVSVVAWAACAAGERGDEAGFAVRDSAGVRIVENHRPRWGAGESIVVAAEPSLQLGAVEGDSPEGFARVVGMRKLPDGTIVVADGGEFQLKYFDAAGRFLRRVGREGGGPGEFQGIGQFFTCGADSLVVWDPWQPRASVFDGGGEYVRGVRFEVPPPSGSVYRLSECGAGGEVVVLGWPRTDGIPQGLHRPAVPVFFSHISDGRIQVGLGEFPGDDRMGSPGGSRPATFGRRTLVAMGDGRVFLGTGDSYEIRGYGLDGTLEVLLRHTRGVLPVTKEDVARYQEAQLSRATDPNQRRAWEQSLAAEEYPANFPAYAAMRTDSEGHLWVQYYSRPGEAGNEWAVFGRDGEWLGDVTMPKGLGIFQIEVNYVLGIWRDELGVDYVRLHEVAAVR